MDWLTEPVTPDAPCGPDLEALDDEAFLDVYYDAEGRLPERYIRAGPQLDDQGRPLDILYDAAAVDITAERKEISALLRRSRDLRLLSLLARWEALAWRLDGLADTVQAMVALIAAHGDAVHPALPDRARDRRGAIEALAVPATILQPLAHLPLSGDRQVTWRRWLVAQGRVEPRPAELDSSGDAILQNLGEKGAAIAVEKTQTDLSRLLQAAQALDAKRLAPLIEQVSGMLDLIAQARPDLTAPEPELPPAPAPDTPVAPSPVAPAPIVGEPKTRADARAALSAVESYLVHAEPSSAALLLVIQARQLIGRPLVEAIETLLPDSAAKAVVDFGPATGFAMSMERLKALTADIPAPPESEDPTTQPPQVATRPDAAAQLLAVGAWFRRSEPASPIPILLDRARTWLERDFEAILKDILPSADMDDG
ncbi:MAG: type VI secretion system ImpA family N-terminal domain-containing protein [Pseudomonadota bacterium]